MIKNNEEFESGRRCEIVFHQEGGMLCMKTIQIIELETRLDELSKELRLHKSWVKHHQKSVENAMSEKNDYKTKLDEANELLREACRVMEKSIKVCPCDDVDEWGCHACKNTGLQMWDDTTFNADDFLNKPEIKALYEK